MSEQQLTLTDPDKLGLLVRCRQKMDELNVTELRKYARSIVGKLSPQRLKEMLFIGLNGIKENIERSELQQMNTSINKIINIKKKKKSKLANARNNDIDEMSKEIKHSSLSQTIPSDIIGKNICSFLMMRGITSLARCDRILAMICHFIMHRYDPYSYGETSADMYIDGDFSWCTLNEHRLHAQNVGKLSISLEDVRRLSSFHKVKDLSIFGHANINDDCVVPAMTSVENLCIQRIWGTIKVNAFEKCRNLKSISLINCSFADIAELNNFVHDERDPDTQCMCQEYHDALAFILPSQPNMYNVEKLKFIDSELKKPDYPKVNEASAAFENIENVKASLSNLKALVHSHMTLERLELPDMYHSLSKNILENLPMFKKLESIHAHASNGYLPLIDLILLNNDTSGLAQISELCFNVSLDDEKIQSRLKRISLSICRKLKKLCLVIRLSETTSPITQQIATFVSLVKSILPKHNACDLELFQIVFLCQSSQRNKDIDTQFCISKIETLSKCIKQFVPIFEDNRSEITANQPLLFRMHVKSCHTARDSSCKMDSMYKKNSVHAKMALSFGEAVRQLFVNYLTTYPLGKIQFKWTYNAWNHGVITPNVNKCMKELDGMFEIVVKEVDQMRYDYDDKMRDEFDRHSMYAISASSKDLAEKNVHHQNKWIADCRWCCNTPWV